MMFAEANAVPLLAGRGADPRRRRLVALYFTVLVESAALATAVSATV